MRHVDAVRRGKAVGVLVGGAEQGEHAAAARALAGLPHQAPAQHDQLECVELVDGLGGHQRGELAQRVPGHRGRRLQRPGGAAPAGDARAEDRGLRETGAVGHAGEGILADELQAVLEEVGGLGGDEVAHPGLMRALAGEHDRGRHANKPTADRRPDDALRRSCPPHRGEARYVWGDGSGE